MKSDRICRQEACWIGGIGTNLIIRPPKQLSNNLPWMGSCCLGDFYLEDVLILPIPLLSILG